MAAELIRLPMYEDLTTSYADVTGSSFTYTPPSETKVVVYDFQVQVLVRQPVAEDLPGSKEHERRRAARAEECEVISKQMLKFSALQSVLSTQPCKIIEAATTTVENQRWADEH